MSGAETPPTFSPDFGADGFLDAFARRATAEPDRVFCSFDGEAITFGGLHAQSDALAAALGRSGIVAGERVAVMLRNGPATPAVIIGLAKSGAIWVPVNVHQRGAGLEFLLAKSTPVAVIADDDLVAEVARALAATGLDRRIIVNGGAGPDSLRGILAAGRTFDAAYPAPDATLAIMFTSGTTGEPKGVMVTHAMLRLSGEGVALLTGIADGAPSTFLVWEPLYHIGGCQLLVLPIFHEVRLAMLHRFSASRFWSQARSHGATHIHYLGGVLQLLLKQPPSTLDRSHGVRMAWGGGCAPEIWRPFAERFGVEIRECYGMTEASSITTYNAGGPVGSVGRPVPWLAVDIADHDGPLPPGERGEIVVRQKIGHALLKGYFDNPEATARTLRDGALHTGDIGSTDAAGYLFFHGRRTDNVRCRGENVSAWEVEHVAAAHPDVEDCAMIGVAAEIGEQDIKIFVKPRLHADISPPELSAWLGARLASFQNPRYISIIEDFERTPSQRIMKHRLSTALDDCWDRLATTPGAAQTTAAPVADQGG